MYLPAIGQHVTLAEGMMERINQAIPYIQRGRE
jgi:hypothetical protein